MARLGKKITKFLMPLTRMEAVEVVEEFSHHAFKNGRCAIDTETSGKCWYRDNLLMVAMYTAGFPAVVIPLFYWAESTITPPDLQIIMEPLLKERDNFFIYAHNAKFDMHFLENFEVRTPHPYVDTMLMARMADNVRANGLKPLSKSLLGIQLSEFSQFKVTKKKPLWRAPLRQVAKYAADDPRATYLLGEHLLQGSHPLRKGTSIGGDVELGTLFRKVEQPITHILQRMERRGLLLNKKAIEEYISITRPEMEGMKSKIIKMLGSKALINGAPVNINSHKQLMTVFKRFKLNIPNTAEETLRKWSTRLPAEQNFIKLLLDYREKAKEMSTYALGILEKADMGGRVHTDFNQAVDTGRLSSKSPNMQNIKRDGSGSSVRDFFMPPPGYCFIDLDYGQLELRVAAHCAVDKVMIQEFADGVDIHKGSATGIFNKSIEEITPDERQAGKATSSFGVMFGMSASALAIKINSEFPHMRVTADKADLFIENWFRKYRGVDWYFRRLIDSAKMTGYVRTFLGRKRMIPELTSPKSGVFNHGIRMVKNTAIQGGAADLVKLALVNTEHPEVWRTGARLLLQVHDELLFIVPIKNAVKAAKIIKERMEKFPVALKLRVTLPVDGGVGMTWSKAKKGDMYVI